MTASDRLRHVLAEQRFPAARWELLVTADLYGADNQTRRELRDLPAARFRSLDDVVLAVQHG